MNEETDDKKMSEVNKLAIEALEQIANPMKYLRDEAEKDGCILDGYMAMQLINNANFYRDIASKALDKINANNS